MIYVRIKYQALLLSSSDASKNNNKKKRHKFVPVENLTEYARIDLRSRKS